MRAVWHTCYWVLVAETVLLVHSGGFTSRQWRKLAERLAPDYRVLAPDLIGYGAQPRWPPGKPFHFSQDVVRLAGLLDAPAHVVGHSYGGLLVLQLALAHPELVRSITAYEPVAFAVLGDHDVEGLPAYVPDAAGVDEAWLAAFVDWWNGPGAWAALPEDTRRAFRDVAWKVSQEVGSLAADRTPRERYASIAAPTLLLGGGRTPAVEQRVVAELAALLPNATLRTFPELGHMGPITHASLVNAAIEAHLRVH
jgi:pimeloyl-ACP methyl ester carboxylesterase